MPCSSPTRFPSSSSTHTAQQRPVCPVHGKPQYGLHSFHSLITAFCSLITFHCTMRDMTYSQTPFVNHFASSILTAVSPGYVAVGTPWCCSIAPEWPSPPGRMAPTSFCLVFQIRVWELLFQMAYPYTFPNANLNDICNEYLLTFPPGSNPKRYLLCKFHLSKSSCGIKGTGVIGCVT